MSKEEKADNSERFILEDEIDLTKLISFLFKNRIILLCFFILFTSLNFTIKNLFFKTYTSEIEYLYKNQEIVKENSCLPSYIEIKSRMKGNETLLPIYNKFIENHNYSIDSYSFSKWLKKNFKIIKSSNEFIRVEFINKTLENSNIFIDFASNHIKEKLNKGIDDCYEKKISTINNLLNINNRKYYKIANQLQKELNESDKSDNFKEIYKIYLNKIMQSNESYYEDRRKNKLDFSRVPIESIKKTIDFSVEFNGYLQRQTFFEIMLNSTEANRLEFTEPFEIISINQYSNQTYISLLFKSFILGMFLSLTSVLVINKKKL